MQMFTLGNPIWMPVPNVIQRSWKKLNKYRCPACKKILLRDSEKKWIKSYCREKGRDVRIMKVNNEKT